MKYGFVDEIGFFEEVIKWVYELVELELDMVCVVEYVCLWLWFLFDDFVDLFDDILLFNFLS